MGYNRGVSIKANSLQLFPSHFSDPNFIARLKGRERAALTELVDAFLPQLLRTGRRMGFTTEESEELAQSVFTALLESLERFEGRSNIRTYLFGIFHNKVSAHWREKQKAHAQDPIDEVMESKFDLEGRWRQPPLDIEALLYAQEVRSILQACLEALPQSQRIAYYLREIDEIKSPEICKKMGISRTNLGVLLFRARNRLRECLEKKGVRRS